MYRCRPRPGQPEACGIVRLIEHLPLRFRPRLGPDELRLDQRRRACQRAGMPPGKRRKEGFPAPRPLRERRASARNLARSLARKRPSHSSAPRPRSRALPCSPCFRPACAASPTRREKFAIALFPKAQDGPPVAHGLTAVQPAARLVILHEAPRTDAAAAQGAVHFHFSQRGRKAAHGPARRWIRPESGRQPGFRLGRRGRSRRDLRLFGNALRFRRGSKVPETPARRSALPCRPGPRLRPALAHGR